MIVVFVSKSLISFVPFQNCQGNKKTDSLKKPFRDLEEVYVSLMAQGKLKVKNKGNVPASKKKHDKKPSNLKKGKHFIAPKKKVTFI